MHSVSMAELQSATVSSEKPQSQMMHQLNLQANAVRRHVLRSMGATRPEPQRLVRRLVAQN